MRNVKRIKKPLILKRKASSWMKELLRELGKGARADKKKLETIYRRYNIPDVKKALDSMYKNLCCYCESTVGVVDYPHIEHRKPKKRFPELTFDWDNLNLACEKCNISKGDKYNKNAPILDAVIDKPITNHLEYEPEIGGIYRIPKTKKGKTTVEHTDLNRDALLGARLKVYLEVRKVIERIQRNLGDLKNDIRITQLKKKSKEQYGSMIKDQMLISLNF